MINDRTDRLGEIVKSMTPDKNGPLSDKERVAIDTAIDDFLIEFKRKPLPSFGISYFDLAVISSYLTGHVESHNFLVEVPHVAETLGLDARLVRTAFEWFYQLGLIQKNESGEYVMNRLTMWELQRRTSLVFSSPTNTEFLGKQAPDLFQRMAELSIKMPYSAPGPAHSYFAKGQPRI